MMAPPYANGSIHIVMRLIRFSKILLLSQKTVQRLWWRLYSRLGLSMVCRLKHRKVEQPYGKPATKVVLQRFSRKVPVKRLYANEEQKKDFISVWVLWAIGKKSLPTNNLQRKATFVRALGKDCWKMSSRKGFKPFTGGCGLVVLRWQAEEKYCNTKTKTSGL